MRCRECAARVAATARVCSRCGAPIVGSGGSALAAGMAGQVLPEPYVPGSGDRLPAELRLVLAGYVGLAGGMFAGGLACAAAAVLFFLVETDYLNDDLIRQLLGVILSILLLGSLPAFGALELVKARSRFSTLLGQSTDPHSATVVALKRGGRTLILDIPWDGSGREYQPLSEVRPALWMNAGMLEPGERVTVFGGRVVRTRC